MACVCEREGRREGGREGGRQRQRQRQRQTDRRTDGRGSAGPQEEQPATLSFAKIKTVRRSIQKLVRSYKKARPDGRPQEAV